MAIRKSPTTAGAKREIVCAQSKKHPGLYELKFKGGGEVPDVWKDHLFTSEKVAQKWIESYLASR